MRKIDKLSLANYVKDLRKVEIDGEVFISQDALEGEITNWEEYRKIYSPEVSSSNGVKWETRCCEKALSTKEIELDYKISNLIDELKALQNTIWDK